MNDISNLIDDLQAALDRGVTRYLVYHDETGTQVVKGRGVVGSNDGDVFMFSVEDEPQ